MRFESFIGKRYLFSSKGDFLVSILTFIAIVGVAMGVLAPIVVLSVVTGFEQEFREKILGNNSHIVVIRWGQRTFSDYESVLSEINKVNGVSGVTPFLYEEVLIRADSGKTAGVLVYGIDPNRVDGVTSLSEDMVAGDLFSLNDDTMPPKILLGSELANHILLATLGDDIQLVTPSGEITPFGMVPKVRTFRQTGIFKSGLYEFDSRSVYVHLREAQRVFGHEGKVSGLQVSVNNLSRVNETSLRLQSHLGEKYLVRTWMEMNRDLFSAFKLEKTVFFIVMVLIVLIAAFNIGGTLILVVADRRKEIAILKAMGATKRNIIRIFMTTGGLVSLFGVTIGLSMAALLLFLLRDVIRFPLNANVYQVDNLPVHIDPFIFVVVAVCAMVVSLLATWYPAWRAANVNAAMGVRGD